MPTLFYSCGGECGVTGTSTHWDTSINGTPTFDTGLKRSGDRSILLNPTAATESLGFSIPAGNRTLFLSCYVYFNSLPSATAHVFGDANVGAYYNSSDGKIYAGTSPIGLGATGVSVTTGQWYRLDVKINKTANPWLCDVQVNDTACGQASEAVGATDVTAFVIGTIVVATYSSNYDDICASVTAGDYPIGPGYVNHFVPTADGTHNVAGADDFERGNTGTDITNATTTAYQLVDDVPLPSAASATDNIQATAPPNATDYVECLFGPAPGISTPTTGPRCVDVVLGHHQAATQSGNIRVAVNDNGTIDDVLNLTAAGVTTIRYARKAYADPPSAASVWNANNDGSDGDFRDLRFRFYSSDAAPDQRLDAIMIEAEFAETFNTQRETQLFVQQAIRRASFY